MDPFNVAGRSATISNIDNTGNAGGVTTLEALLNNVNVGRGSNSNSSPKFTTIPTPFYCINIPQQYNQGAVDADNDSLVYALAPGLNGQGMVTYLMGYSATAPLATTPGTFSFSSATGQMSFTPNAVQRSLVVNKVSEYRHGVLVGTASREMTFIVIDKCNNSPAYSIIDTTAYASGGVAAADVFYVCPGTDSIHFHIVPRTPGIDTIFASVNGLPAGATATITRNNTATPVIAVGWKTLSVPTGRYNFFVTYRNNVCPLTSQQTQAYTIQILQMPVASFVGPDVLCQRDTATFTFNGIVGSGPLIEYKWDWDHPDYVTGLPDGPWRVHWAGAGEKIVRLVVLENKCPSPEIAKEISVKSTPYAGFDVADKVCQYDTLRVTHYKDLTLPINALQYTWNFDDADTQFANGPGPYTLRWYKAGTKHISLSIGYGDCVGTYGVDIKVLPVPYARILNAPGPVCIGEKIFLTATGGRTYLWAPQDSMLYAPDGRLYTQILKPSTYRVVAISDDGCIDSAAISYDVVEPCCNFAYPNAFSPNGDGRNDRFRIVTYGNYLQYELSIYNSWGQRVYYGLDAKEGWDGTFNGKPCDGGTYFYYLNAKCFTGHQEVHKGNLTLLK